MKKYMVTILFTTVKTVLVMAEDKDMAKQIAIDECETGDEDNYWESEPSIEVSEMKVK